MSEIKGENKIDIADKDESANAPIPVDGVKKSIVQDGFSEQTWEDLGDDNYEIIKEVDFNGQKNLVYKKKKGCKDVEPVNKDDQGIVYPEIVWYFISSHIKPEDVGRFAGINKVTYSITKQEFFWRSLYRKYCQNSKILPEKLKIENNNKVYGLRQRVIRGLHYTYNVFTRNIAQQVVQGSIPHLLVNRKCINMWYVKKRQGCWIVFFKFKKCHFEWKKDKMDFFEELDRIDANPEEDCQVLQVICGDCPEIPPLMGMTLASVRVVLSCGFRHYRLQLGFNRGSYTRSRNIMPEQSILIEKVSTMFVYDWWLRMYPHSENSLPLNRRDEESRPVLKDFFAAISSDTLH